MENILIAGISSIILGGISIYIFDKMNPASKLADKIFELGICLICVGWLILIGIGCQ